MKRVVTLMVLLISTSSFAGKRERDFLKNEVAPVVKASEAKFKSACGCALKIVVNEASYKELDDMRSLRSMAEDIGTEGAGYCTDAESKKAMCQMKTFEIMFGADATFTFKGGKATATTYGGTRPSWDMIARELDK